MSAGLGAAIYQYEQIATEVDSAVKGGFLAIVIPSMAKILSAMHIRSYATTRSDRTPENRSGTHQFLRLVTLVCVGSTFLVLHLLNNHALTTADALAESTVQANGAVFNSALLGKAMDAINNTQFSLVLNLIVHCLLHYLTHSLDKIERDLPQIVDLHAADSKPKEQ